MMRIHGQYSSPPARRTAIPQPAPLPNSMASSQPTNNAPGEGETPPAVAYDPTDPFWNDDDGHEDDDDMDFFPAAGDSEEEDGEDDLGVLFHGG